MLHTGTESTVRPEMVAMERIGSGEKIVRLADHVVEGEHDGQAVYTYDEVVFTLDAGREETKADIQGDFTTWWEYGSQPEEPMPTIEERLELVEMMLMGGI